MMIAIVAVSVLSSCTQVAGWFGSGKDSTQTSMDTLNTAMVRDVSITEANAYSDLFLDSTDIENYIRKEQLADSAAMMMRNFYAVRNNQFAWFATNGLTEQARGLWSLTASQNDSSIKTPESFQQRMDTLLQSDSVYVQKTDSSFVETELNLTSQLIRYAAAHPGGIINKNTLYYLVPARKQDPMQLADSLLNRQKDSVLYAGNAAFSAMKLELGKYYSIAKNGGWQPLAAGTTLMKGMKSPAVIALKKRLQATGDYGPDTTNVFSDSLHTAISDLQQRYGLLPTGSVNDSLINMLNVPAEKRISQILINMNRMLWMQPSMDSNHIMVNIPSYMLYAKGDSGRVLEMPVIVGKEGSGTVMFNGSINQIVFNPSWNIPESIVRDEIMPAMKKDPNYLKKNNMEIVRQNDSLPVIRQLPGKNNALGEVKFLFPNSHDIYLHDTPDKSLFAKKDRALSHGCIRVADATTLASYLLKGQQDWTPEKIKSTMKGDKEETINLARQTAVSITYYTAWLDEKGRLNFRNDVYGHDQDASNKMFSSQPQGT
jgi:L,D-transpeptidase YcbB